MALTASDIDTSKTGAHNTRLERIGMALEGLRNVIKANQGLPTFSLSGSVYISCSHCFY